MIIDLPDTDTGALARKLVDLRESGGAVALGRVLTLIIVTDDGPAEEQIRAANDASREHPCRIIAVVRGNRRGTSRLDAQVRVGGDAGASEVLVLRLWGPLVDHGDSVIVPFLLPDAPVVAWWPGTPPDRPSEDPIGRMAQRRITDAAATQQSDEGARAQRAVARARRHRPRLEPHHPLARPAGGGVRPAPARRRDAGDGHGRQRQPQRRAHGGVDRPDPALPRHPLADAARQRADQRRPGARVRPGGAGAARGQRRHAHPARPARAARLPAAALGPRLPRGGAPAARPGRDLRRGAHRGPQAAPRQGGDEAGPDLDQREAGQADGDRLALARRQRRACGHHPRPPRRQARERAGHRRRPRRRRAARRGGRGPAGHPPRRRPGDPRARARGRHRRRRRHGHAEGAGEHARAGRRRLERRRRLVGRRAVPARGRPGPQRDAGPRRAARPRAARPGARAPDAGLGEPWGDDVDAAAAAYAEELRAAARPEERLGVPTFDVADAGRRPRRARGVAVPGASGRCTRPTGPSWACAGHRSRRRCGSH